MRRGPLIALLLAAAACDGVIMVPTTNVEALDPENPSGTPRRPAASIPTLPSAARCGSVPTGRAYVGLSGEHLEVSRRDAAAFIDLHRPYRGNHKSGNDWAVTSDITASVGADAFSAPESRDPGTGGAFGVVPDRWYEESIVGPFAIYVSFSFAYKACLSAITRPNSRNVTGWYEHTKFEPTPERARAFCQRTQQNAWQRAPETDEVQACADLALNLQEEPDLPRRWAYVCASVITSMNLLSY